MPVFVIPSSLGTAPLREVNRCHGKGRGHPCVGYVSRVTNADFDAVGDAQRGKPERAMTRAQGVMGGGVMDMVIEHVGDLTHRMTEANTRATAGYEFVKPKVERALRYLRDEYGFEREFEENTRNNATHRGVDPSKHKAKVFAALDAYADAHEKVPVHNEAQETARAAAVAIGRRDFPTAVTLLKNLQSHLKLEAEWVAYAHEGLSELPVNRRAPKEGKTTEANACHVPGGSSAGGQFATKGSAGCQPQGELAFGPKPGLIHIGNTADDNASEAVFGGEDLNKIARDLVKDFPLALSCTIKSEGGGPDESDLRERYEKWRQEQIDANHDAYVERKYEEYSDAYGAKSTALEDAHNAVRSFVLEEQPPNTNDTLPTHRMTWDEVKGMWEVAGLDENSVEGFEIDEAHAKALRTMIRENFPSVEIDVPYYDEGHASDFYSDFESFDTWYDDQDDEGDDLASFDDWAADERSNYEGDSSDARVIFHFTSKDPEMPFLMQREFTNDGGLKVHHYLMEDGGKTPPLAKLMMRNAAQTYERLGVEEIEVNSGLSVGGYAWARYGFEPDSSGSIGGQMERRVERAIHERAAFLGVSDPEAQNKPLPVSYIDTGYDRATGERARRTIEATLTPSQTRAVKTLIVKYISTGDVRYFWALNDAHVTGTAVYPNAEVGSPTTRPARFSIGKLLLLGTGYEATLNMNNSAALQRLHEHTGLP